MPLRLNLAVPDTSNSKPDTPFNLFIRIKKDIIHLLRHRVIRHCHYASTLLRRGISHRCWLRLKSVLSLNLPVPMGISPFHQHLDHLFLLRRIPASHLLYRWHGQESGILHSYTVPAMQRNFITRISCESAPTNIYQSFGKFLMESRYQAIFSMARWSIYSRST